MTIVAGPWAPPVNNNSNLPSSSTNNANTNRRVVSKRQLNRQEAIQFIRSQVITLTLIEARPNTKMFVFFGDQNVTQYCRPQGGAVGDDLITDNIGQIVIEFVVGQDQFNTGTYKITVADVADINALNQLGSTFGSASATFLSEGTIDFFQTTRTTIVTIERPVPAQVDPLAQSFFTYGVRGGMFLSAVDVFFATKDQTLPVRMEIRPMVNGYPAKFEVDSANFVSVLAAADVNVSQNASVPTKFTFNPPIYLEEDSDFCFVLRTNSNNYQVYTSRLGESSIEDGRKIYDQPYVGSVFKSENNITWTAEQFEDIKFTIYKAEFNTATNSTVRFNAEVPQVAAYGYQFSTVSGSNVVTYRHPQDHGLFVDSKFNVVTRTDAVYNGIPSSEFNKAHTVTEVLDSKTIRFAVVSLATKTGKIDDANLLNYIGVEQAGGGYLETDTVTITGGGGTGAAASLILNNGNVSAVEITNPGSGYTSNPIVSINTSTGVGAVLYSSVIPTFSVGVNKPYTAFMPTIDSEVFGDSGLNSTLYTTLGNFDGGNLVPYTGGQSLEFKGLGKYFDLKQNSLIASPQNETSFMSGNSSATVEYRLNSANPNVSPVINLKTAPQLHVFNTLINSQSGEDLDSTNSTGSLDSVVITAAGSGYTVTPIVTISAPDMSNGVQATATAVLTGGYISAINVTAAGSGYTKKPLITITRGSGDTTGIGAAAQAVLTPFNTELLATGGNAKSKYITKPTKLEIVSNGVRIFSTISSIPGSSVDWYIRTSNSSSGVQHELLEWKKLECRVDRNKSSFIGEFLEYEFRLDNLPEYDTYDLKCILSATDPTRAPIVKSYRVIALT